MSLRALREARRMFKVGDRLGTAGRPDYTERNRALLEQGLHPVTKTAARPELGTCGDCAHHTVNHASRRYHKCLLHPLGPSRSEASDIRVGWPACERFEPEGG